MSENAFDERNQQDYDNYTDKINEALDKIASTPSLKATLTELSRLTGMHRNTLTNRDFPKRRLEAIKEERNVRQELKKRKKKDFVKELEEQLDKAGLELVHWFTMYQAAQRETGDLGLQLKRKQASLESHMKELKAEREKTDILEKELENTKQLLRDIK